jgi:hypothetical protein
VTTNRRSTIWVGCDALSSGRSLTKIRRNVQPPYSRSKNEPSLCFFHVCLRAWLNLPPWSWKQHVLPKRLYMPTCTRRHGVISAFITVFTRPYQWYLSWARWIQSTHSQANYLRFSLMLSLHRWLPSGLFPSGSSTKILYAFLISIVRAMYPALFSFNGTD